MGGGNMQPANKAAVVPGGGQAPMDGFMQQMLASFMGPGSGSSLGSVMQPMPMGGAQAPLPPNAGGPMPPQPMPSAVPSQNLMGAFQQGSNAIAQQAATPFIKPPPRPGVGGVAPAGAGAGGFKPNTQQQFMLAMGADPKKVLGKDYNTWASTPVTRGEMHAKTSKPEEKRRGGSR